MAYVNKYIVSHRSGCGMCEPKVYNTHEDAKNAVTSSIAKMVKEYIHDNYDEDDDEYKELSKLKTDEDIVQYGTDMDLCSDENFMAYSDWEEFMISPVKIHFESKDIVES